MKLSIRILLVAALVFTGLCSIGQDASHYFVFLNSNPDRETLPEAEVKSLQEGHIQNIKRLYEEGWLPAAGPFHDGGGIFVFRTSSVEQTDSLLQTDPAVRAGRFRLETYPLIIQSGGICRVGEDYEMADRVFIRLTATEDKAQMEDEVHRMMQNLFNDTESGENEPIFSAVFGGRPEGIWIFDGEPESLQNVLDNQEDFRVSGITYEIRKLWIARGAFCE